jgi:two-component system cell cycle response regulator
MARILVVDDNRDVCKSLTRILKHLGYDAHFAASGPEALTLVREHAPDLIILDVMMPGMDGLEVLQHLKNDPQTSALPVVMFSAITDDQFRGRAMRGGAVDYWVKASVNFDELGTRLNKLLNVPSNN